MTPTPFPSTKRSKPSAILFVGLNILRVLSVVVMMLLFAGQIWGCSKDVKAFKQAMNGTKTTVNDDYELECDYIEFSSIPDQAGGLFWSILSRVFILMAILILLPPELYIPTNPLQSIYHNNLPILSPAHGLGFLGVIQCWIASVVLSKYVGKFEQVVGWLGFIVGCLNLVAGITLRSSAKERRKIFSWENVAQLTPQTKAAHAAYTTSSEKLDKFLPIAQTMTSYVIEKTRTKEPLHSSSASFISQETLVHPTQPQRGDTEEAKEYLEPELNRASDGGKGVAPGLRFGGFGFGKQREKQGGLNISVPVESLPRYASAESLRRPRNDA